MVLTPPSATADADHFDAGALDHIYEVRHPRPSRLRRLEQLTEPFDHSVPDPFEWSQHTIRAPPTHLAVLLESMQHETDSGRIHWTRNDVNQAAQM